MKFQKCPPVEINANEDVVPDELEESFEFTQQVKTECIVYHFVCLFVWLEVEEEKIMSTRLYGSLFM